MPSVGQLSSTRRSLGPGEYAPTDEAYTSAGTPAAATARKTRSLPCTFVARSRLVPTLPDAPTTTTRMRRGYPAGARRNGPQRWEQRDAEVSCRAQLLRLRPRPPLRSEAGISAL